MILRLLALIMTLLVLPQIAHAEKEERPVRTEQAPQAQGEDKDEDEEAAKEGQGSPDEEDNNEEPEDDNDDEANAEKQ